MIKLFSLFKNKETTSTTTTMSATLPWQWSSCKHPKTLSFRAGDNMYKTVNSVFFDSINQGVETPESWFTNSFSESTSFTTESEDYCFDGESLETVVRGARSERLFFEPEDTSSILEKAKAGEINPFEESVVLAIESEDPYKDFRRSMEEMVESHGLKDWECLDELLGWYLKVNKKKNHGFIVGAFVDLLVALAAAAASNDNVKNANSCRDHTYSTSFSSAVSSFSSPLSSSFQDHNDEIAGEEEIRMST